MFKKNKSETPLVEISIPTADGNFIAHYSDKGLAGLDFPAKKSARVLSANPKANAQILRWHRATADALKAMLAGRATKNLPPIFLFAARMRWQGTRTGIGFAPHAPPTARTALGFLIAPAISP